MWQFVDDGPWSRWQCDLLACWPHGFFTRLAEGRRPPLLAPSLGLAAELTYQLRQVHSALVLEAPVEPGTEGDGLLTGQAGHSVWVGSADCTPVLLVDPQRQLAAAVHAGWRGTAQRIVPMAVEHLCRRGATPERLLCALGPAISGPAYQVGEAVALEVTRTIAEAELALLPDSLPGRLRLDVREVNRQQLVASGLRPEHISICPACTYQTPEVLYSYRREGSGKIQYSGIGLPVE